MTQRTPVCAIEEWMSFDLVHSKPCFRPGHHAVNQLKREKNTMQKSRNQPAYEILSFSGYVNFFWELEKIGPVNNLLVGISWIF